MKLDRLLGILTVLLQKEKVTAPFLAEKFEVSRRTINRDIEDICKAGIPLVTMQGAHGGISIAEGYKIDKNFLTYEELKSIMIGLKGLESVSKTSHIEQLLDKLSVNDENMVSLKDNIIIDLSSHYKSSLSEKISVLKGAINNRNIVSFQYFSANGEGKRIIEPYYITFKWSSWYVFGYCLDRDDFRLFKLNRINDLIIIERIFNLRELPVDKEDLNNYFTDEIYITVLFDPCVKYRLIDEYGFDSFVARDDGKLLFKTNFTDKQYMLSWIFSYGDKIEVLEPVEIKEEVIQINKNIFKIYREHDI